MESADVVVIAVKPQDAPGLLADLGPRVSEGPWSSRFAPACPPRSSPSTCPRAPRWFG